jgi:hypothetical protein
MTNFATFTASGNGKAPVAQLGKVSSYVPTCGWSGSGWW